MWGWLRYGSPKIAAWTAHAIGTNKSASVNTHTKRERESNLIFLKVYKSCTNGEERPSNLKHRDNDYCVELW